MKRILFISFLLIVAATSCKKETVSPTQAQLTAAKIKSDINLKGGGITSVSYFLPNGTSYTATSYSITSDGFITIDGVTFNLGQLKYYTVTPPILDLYF